jgi:protein-S-isoprenylcysteine O-methyltransferase Ste14
MLLLAFKSLLFIALAPVAVTVLIPVWWMRALRGVTNPVLEGLGWGLVVSGVCLFAACVAQFIVQGRGTPAPYDPPRRLVARGLYRFSRNPMYVSIAWILGGEALILASWWHLLYAAAVCAAFHLRVILYEEPRLAAQFGRSFQDYRRNVPRWFC